MTGLFRTGGARCGFGTCRRRGRAVTLIGVKRLWRCPHPHCEVVTWSERSEAIRPRSLLTERARKEACRWVGRDGHTVAQVAAQFGVGWATVMKAVTEYGRPAVDDPARLDGVRTRRRLLRPGRAGRRRWPPASWTCPGLPRGCWTWSPAGLGKRWRSESSQQPPGWAERAQVGALYPFRGYVTALTAAPDAGVGTDRGIDADPLGCLVW